MTLRPDARITIERVPGIDPYWKWEANNGHGLSAEGNTDTTWGAFIASRRALRQMGRISKREVAAHD